MSEEIIEVEAEAKLMGWVPEEEWKGDPERWTSAEDYVERGKTVMPILKSQLNKFRDEIVSKNDELSATKAEIKELRDTMKKVVETTKKISEQEYNRALETIKKQQIEAVGNADAETYQKLEDQKAQLKKPEVVVMKDPVTDNVSQAEAWKAANKWYAEKPQMGMYASSIENFVASQNPGKSVREVLDLVTEEVKKRFPEEFENKNAKKPTAVDDGGIREAGDIGGGKKSYRDLPKDAKLACDEMCKSIPNMTRDKYVEMYPWD